MFKCKRLKNFSHCSLVLVHILADLSLNRCKRIANRVNYLFVTVTRPPNEDLAAECVFYTILKRFFNESYPFLGENKKVNFFSHFSDRELLINDCDKNLLLIYFFIC